ncbi:MAG TPA: trypsin-like peptidase domain-containing protein [Gemmatimonadaceae bacterium]|nr:trypsin-like peptidase domain-containing protein [Gemmatimonadaceae bacterium]
MSSAMTNMMERDAQLALELAAVAAQLRRTTVEVRTARGAGCGSGVIWRADGLIITNAHVMRGGRASVALWDGRVHDATVVSRDSSRDLAMLSIKATDLPAAPRRDTGTLHAGELVLAVGSPLGISGAVAAGIVHAPSWRGLGGRRWVRADLRLAPGNSGGPMADARGRVVGINSMIVAGLAAAVPTESVERFVRGTARPSLGIVARPVLVPLAAGRALGLLVTQVAPESAAGTAGVLTGDVLITADGQPFTAPGDLIGLLDEMADAGGTLQLGVVRGGRWVTLDVVPRARAPRVEAA